MSLTLAQVNALSKTEFVNQFASIIEHSPWVAQIAHASAPFATINDLHRAMVQAVKSESRAKWLEILNLHPELSGKEAEEGRLTNYSTQEQSGIGLNRLSKEQFAHMRDFNTRYRQKFGFPFVICVRLVKDLDALFAEQARRINLSFEDELITAIGQVYEIARLRLEQAITV